jgi:phosphoglycerol transferase MdoB-like AlkP superfamily enzyme
MPSLERYRPLLALASAYLVLGVALRLVLWARFGVNAGVGASSLGWILPAGLAADAVQSLYLLAPLALWLGLAPDRWHVGRGTRALLLGGSALWLFSMLFVAACEYFFFEEFDARFNLVSVHYLMYPTEVAGDIRAEYPVTTLLAVAAVLALAVTALLRRPLTAGTRAPTPFRARVGVLLGMVATTLLTAFTFETNALGLSDNRVANELAANGPSSFFRALQTSEIGYHAYYATRDRNANLDTLAASLVNAGGRFTRLSEGRLDREFPARLGGLGKLNVILVSSESFGAEFSRLYGSERDWTPRFDRYAQQGLWFANTYSSGTRTVRGLEAITSSIPPIPSESVVRRPGNADISTLGKVLRGHGYHTSFLYGGYGYFDNMNAFYASNGYEVLDRNAMTKPPRFENIWGVADEDLFDMTLAHADSLAAAGKPFFLHVMTTSNHKPFTFRSGLESSGIKAQGGGRESGVRYADHAQGYFLAEAAKHGWFDDTIFIIVADHGARVYGREEIPLKTYEIPLMFYAPKHIAPRRVDGLTTQLDIAPTLMGLLGLPYTAPWFGRDVLNTPEQGRVAFFSHNHNVAMLRDGRLTTLGLRNAVSQLNYDRARDRYSPASPAPDDVDLAIAFYQTAFEQFREGLYR